MFYLIYKITNTMNNKEYIGSHKTDNIHDSYMSSGTAIRNAIKKPGKDNFVKEILHVFDTPDEMFAKEREIVTEDYIKRSDTYNLMVGGLGAGPGHLNPFYGKKHRPESIQQNIQTQKVKYENGHINAFKGKTHSEETKQHWSEIRKGKRKGTENSFFGKEHSEESKKLISESWKTNKEERCANISDGRSVAVNVYNSNDELQNIFKNRQVFNEFCKENKFPRSLYHCSKDQPYNPAPKRHYPYKGWYVTRG